MIFLTYRYSLFVFIGILLISFSCNNGGSAPSPPEVEPATKFTIATSAGVGGSITNSQNVDRGQSVKITATANEHFQLKEWTGDCGTFDKDNSEITITASKNCQVVAEFEKIIYTIRANSKGGGSISESELLREQGQIASFTAEPDEGYQFGNWTIKEGTDCPTLQDLSIPKVTFTVEGNCSLEAVFAKAPRTITIGENENGEITIAPSLTVNHGEDVEITATANQHYEFKGWAGTCGDLNNDEATITITLVSDCTIDAIFEKLSYTITSTSSDGGQVRHLGSVIDEELSVKYGETITLIATPQEGYQFSEWTTIGDADCPALTDDDTSNPEWTQVPRLEFVVEGNCSLEAVFNKAPRTITIAENDNGEINISPSETVEHGDEVEIVAKANQHYEFKGWAGTCDDLNEVPEPQNDESSLTIIVVKDCTIEAVFEKVNYTIKVTSSEGGSVARDGQQVNEELSIVYGETVAFTVTPDESYQFSGWRTEGGSSSTNCPSLEDSTEVETEFIVEGNCSLNAVFEKAVFTISVLPSEGGQVRHLGSVTRVGQQIDEELSLVHGQKATITAIPDEGYVFAQWKSVEGTDCPSLSDDDASNPDRTRAPRLEFTVLGDCQLQAIFTQKPYTISTSSNEGGEITETLTANEGDQVSITAIADEHHQFKDWEGNCGEFNADDLTVSFEATKDCEIKAVFTKVLYTLTVEAGSGGSVDKTEGGIGFGDNFKVEATPEDGYDFERWTTTGSGCPDNLDTTYSIASFKVEGNCQLQAEFIFTGEYDETPQHDQQIDDQEPTINQLTKDCSLPNSDINGSDIKSDECTQELIGNDKSQITNIKPSLKEELNLDLAYSIPIKGNSWVVGDISKNTNIHQEGIRNWTDLNDEIRTYFKVPLTGKLHVGLAIKSPDGSSKIKVTLGNESKELTIKNRDYENIEVGVFNIETKGYQFIELKGIDKSSGTIADITDILIGGPATRENPIFVKDDFYYGRRGPTVHLTYEANTTDEIEWFYNEVTVPKGADVLGSFIMAAGFNGGYFGMQVNSNTERRILFSVFSPHYSQNPAQTPQDYKVLEMAKGSNVTVREFGDEGTGLQSLMGFDWKSGNTYKFLVRGFLSTNSTTDFTAYFYAPEIGRWQLISSLRRPFTNTYLSHFHSFLENFSPRTGHITRIGLFTNQWIRDTKGQWHEMTKAKFNVDATGRKKARADHTGGVESGSFYLKNCGFFDENTPPDMYFVRDANGTAPSVDVSSL